MASVGFIGLGAMGGRMAQRLIEAGHELTVWNRTPARAEPLAAAGAAVAATAADAARAGEIVITMVADANALRAVTEGAHGAITGLRDAAVLVEMSTVGPAAVHELSQRIPTDAGLLDAPVLGSVDEARDGALRIFVGGPPAVLHRVRPVLDALGEPLHAGQLGSGAAAKLVANSTLFGVLGVLGEALALGDGLGLARETIFDVLAATPLSAQAERRRAAVEAGSYPPRFTVSLARKDAELIAAAARGADLELRVTDAARRWLVEADEAGWGALDYSSVLARILRQPAPRQ